MKISTKFKELSDVNDIDDEIDEQESRQYWAFSPGEYAHRWDIYLKNGIIDGGWEVGDISNVSSTDEIKGKLIKGRVSLAEKQMLLTFKDTIKKGDIICARYGCKYIIGVGVVTSDYRYDGRCVYPHIRNVDWIYTTYIENALYLEDIGEDKWFTQRTFSNITHRKELCEKLDELIGESRLNKPFSMKNSKGTKYTKADFLKDVFISENEYDRLVSLLERKKNIILQGAPGVGKTFMSRRLAYSILGAKDASKVMFVQFHQSYGYEDFVLGYRPSENGFELRYGPFYEFCKKAQEDSDTPYFMIIDEINRGNISKILGELLMLIESDKRGAEIRLTYGKELFSVPKNLYIIGMMNTADRSLAVIDYALRRRFAFYQVEPAFDSAGFKKLIAGNETLGKLVNAVKQLNSEIKNAESLGEGFQIGHSFFCSENIARASDDILKDIVQYEIIPLISEYWFDDQEKFKLEKQNLLDVFND